jgi:pilus assembly protein CpaB
MRRQSTLLIGGLVLGLVGFILTFAYVRNVQGKAASNSEVVTAFVASEAIPAGTPGSVISEVVEEKDIPRAYLQPGALVDDLSAVIEKFTIRQIVPGQTLTATDFGQVGESEGRLPIPKGHEAVAIATSLDGGLGQYAQPGDKVSVYATFRQGTPTTRKLLSNVLVIATQANPQVGDKLTGVAPGTTTGLLFVLAVTPQQAGKLIFGQRMGEVSLTLIPEGQVSPDPDPADATGGLAVSLNPQGQI